MPYQKHFISNNEISPFRSSDRVKRDRLTTVEMTEDVDVDQFNSLSAVALMISSASSGVSTTRMMFMSFSAI